MHINDYYTSGEFAKKANVSVRTIRYYDKQNILKPSLVNESGARFYTDSDFTRLQQVLLLKYLGFSLDEIRNMTIGDSDYHILLNSLSMQQKLIKDKIAQMQLVDKALTSTTAAIKENKAIDWSRMLDLIHLTNMESSLQNQYINASNISARINLHTLYSTNKMGWFPWVYKQCGLPDSTDSKGRYNIKVLEIGCGDGSLWTQNYKLVSTNLSITLSDISPGMLRDARRNIEAIDELNSLKIKYKAFDCASIPFNDNSFDIIIANHVLFYCDNLDTTISEIKRVLKYDGRFICSTYDSNHMKEISELVQKFDSRIVLAKNNLFNKFGLNNGNAILSSYFNNVELRIYEDSLIIDRPEPLTDYILSCHGNQKQYLLDRYADFKIFLSDQIHRSRGSIKITKEAGIFICFQDSM